MKSMEEWEDFALAPYAMKSSLSLGRQFPESTHPYRSIYQRDRERIVHSTSFRRLLGKTQVLVGRINDHHRNRLTHSLEVAQISRTIARRLRLHEDLTEAIALAHDIGHPPFGHAGEKVLHECLREHGGFDHNLYGLKRVHLLEDRYPDYPGLNLSWEIRESFVQHSKTATSELKSWSEYRSLGGPLLEAQLVDAADSLAYVTHDLDDALGIGLLTLNDLAGLSAWEHVAERLSPPGQWPNSDCYQKAMIRELIAVQVSDLLGESENRLQQHKIGSVGDVRACSVPLIGFSSWWSEMHQELTAFLFQKVYHHYQVQRLAKRGQAILSQLFEQYCRNPELLPPRYALMWEQKMWEQKNATICKNQRKNSEKNSEIEEKLSHRNGCDFKTQITRGDENIQVEQQDLESWEVVVGDYLAGMTDTFAVQEYQQIFITSADS